MWAGVVYDTLLERHFEYIPLSGGTQIFLTSGCSATSMSGPTSKFTYTEINGKKLARGIWQANSFHAQDTTP